MASASVLWLQDLCTRCERDLLDGGFGLLTQQSIFSLHHGQHPSADVQATQSVHHFSCMARSHHRSPVNAATGIVRSRSHLKSQGLYVEIQVDGSSAQCTKVVKWTPSPSWNADISLCVQSRTSFNSSAHCLIDRQRHPPSSPCYSRTRLGSSFEQILV